MNSAEILTWSRSHVDSVSHIKLSAPLKLNSFAANAPFLLVPTIIHFFLGWRRSRVRWLGILHASPLKPRNNGSRRLRTRITMVSLAAALLGLAVVFKVRGLDDTLRWRTSLNLLQNASAFKPLITPEETYAAMAPGKNQSWRNHSLLHLALLIPFVPQQAGISAT